MRVFIGFTEVAGYFGNLQKGFAKYGVQCTLIDLPQHTFNYSNDTKYNIITILIISLNNWISSLDNNNFHKKTILKICRKFLFIIFFIWAIFKHNVFIYTFGGTFLRYNELKILKLLSKKIIYVFSGSDHRPPYINGSIIYRDNNEVYTLEHCANDTKIIKNKIKVIEKYADIIIGHHLSAHFHEKPFIPFAVIGIPFSLDINNYLSASENQNEAIRILHAPSMLKAKGTPVIRDAIRTLKLKGYNIDYIEITGKPNHEVLVELSKCDFVIDEIYSDARMAGLATEAAFFKKPTVVFGYANDLDFTVNGKLPNKYIPPVIYDKPENILTTIERVVQDEKLRIETGNKCYNFVVNNWERKIVAKKYLMAINDKFPEKYKFEPNNLSYTNGFGLSEEDGRNYIKRLVTKYGLGVLELDDKPILLDSFSNFCK